MTRSAPAMWVGALLVSYLAGVWTGVGGAAIAQQSPAPPSAIPLAPNQGDVVVWAAADLQKAHTELSARSKGRILSKPRDLVQLPMTRTHMFDVVHRPASTAVPTAEQHELVARLRRAMTETPAQR